MTSLKKITALTAGTPTNTDVIPYVDLVAGETKKALKSDLKGDKGDTGAQGNAGTPAVVTSTSTTSLTIGTGSKSLTTATALTVGVGSYVFIAETANPEVNWMFGQITSISGTSVTVNVTVVLGSGTITAWTITLAGIRGPQGAQGPSGTNDLIVGTSVVTSGTSTRILYNNAGVLGEYTLTGTGTVVAMQEAPTFTTSITTPAIKASNAGGIEIKNSSGTDTILTGAGGGTGTSLLGTTNIGPSTADYHQMAGGTGTITDTATGSSTNININLVPKGTGKLQAGGKDVGLQGTSETNTFGTIELGHASDTTITRSSAGVIAVEGVSVPLNSITNTHTAQQIELGHASDTTLTRSAGGVLAVESNLVPSPASQTSGDILYRGASAWERLAKGTAGQVLKMNSGATAPEWGASGGSTDISCRVYQTGTTTLQTTWTVVAFAAEHFDTDTMHDNSTNNSRITIKTAGKYCIGGVVGVPNNSSAGARIRLNGSTILAAQMQGNSAQGERASVSTIYDLAVNDYLELQGNANNQATTGDAETNFWAYKIF